jgi:hypothetical protein
MKPCPDVADDPTHDVKALLDRWSQNGSLEDYDTYVAVWCALEHQGFSDICLRREPHELPHNLWRFSMRRGHHHASCMAVESAVRMACKSIGHSLGKDFVAAMISGSRTRGALILSANQIPLS